MPTHPQIRRRRVSLLLLLILPVLGGTACHDDQPAAAVVVAEAPKSVADHFDVRLGDRTVHLQFAVLQAEMERGLMERRDLGRDEGMIFIYAAPRRMTFWMHDTPTPLAIGFFTPDGALAEIYPLLPFDERIVASRSEGVQFAVEMSQDWYRDRDVRPGARLDLAAVVAALRARGFDPQKFGLGQ